MKKTTYEDVINRIGYFRNEAKLSGRETSMRLGYNPQFMKTIENKSEREMTAICAPFVPCSAKLPIISLFAGFFFPNNSGLVTASLYFLSIAMILLSCLIMKKFFYKKQVSSFVLELPEYKLPSVKYVSRDVFDKTKDFVSRAGTITAISCIMIEDVI